MILQNSLLRKSSVHDSKTKPNYFPKEPVCGLVSKRGRVEVEWSRSPQVHFSWVSEDEQLLSFCAI